MAINHYRISPKFWPKARARGWNDAQINLALYLLTCKHRNLEGLYVLPKPYIAADLAWPAKKVEENLAVLLAAGFAMYDEAAEVILIPKALKHQAPNTDNQIKGAIAQLRAIPRTRLWDAFRMACASHCPRLADATEEAWPSHSDGVSHAHAGSPERATSSSSSSSSNSNPPQPPAERGEQDLQGDSWGKEQPPPNSRAHGTNPRALAQTGKAAAGAIAAKSAAAALSSPTDEHAEAWERVRAQLRVATADGPSWGLHLEPTRLVGVSGQKLVIDGPDETWSWITNRFARLIGQCAEVEGVSLRLATKAEHEGFAMAGVAA